MSADTRNDPRQSPAPTPGSLPTGSVGAGTKRQQRVGILRNPNRAPAPPPRRAPLTGKWFSLRSSRRAAPAVVDSAAQAVAGESRLSAAEAAALPSMIETAQPVQPMKPGHGNVAETVTPARAGSRHAAEQAAPGKPAARIDIARLTEAVADLGEKKSRRRRYGEAVSPTIAPPDPVAGAPTRHGDRGTADDEMHANATVRRVAARHSDVLPALADALDDHERGTGPDEPEQSGAASNRIGARFLRGMLLCCLAGLAIAAMITLPRA